MAKVRKRSSEIILPKGYVQGPWQHGKMPLARYKSALVMLDGFRAAVHNFTHDELMKLYEPKGGDLTNSMRDLQHMISLTIDEVRKSARRTYKTEV